MDSNHLYDFELWKIRVKITRDDNNTAQVYIDGNHAGYYSAASVFIPNQWAIDNQVPTHKINAVFFEMIHKMDESSRANEFWMSLGYSHTITLATWEPVTLAESNAIMFQHQVSN